MARAILVLAVAGCTAPELKEAPAEHPVEVARTAAVVAVRPGDRPCIETSHGCISTNPDVTPETIHQTICVPGYTKSVRPATRFTNGVKRKLLREAGIDESHMGEYELDHLIPLAVGGHPRKLSNLWLQPWDGKQGAHRKDLLERRLQERVCGGEMGLVEAQKCIAENWIQCESQLGGR